MSHGRALWTVLLCGACAANGEFLPYDLEPHGQPSWGTTVGLEPEPEPAPVEAEPIIEETTPVPRAPSNEEHAEWDPFLDRLIGLWNTTGEATHDGVTLTLTASQRTDRVGSLLRDVYRVTDGMDYEGVGYWRPMGKGTWQVLWLDSMGNSALGVARREGDLIVAEYETLGTDKMVRYTILTNADGVLETSSTVPGPDGGWIPSAKSTFARAMGEMPQAPIVEGTHDPVLLDLVGSWEIRGEGAAEPAGSIGFELHHRGQWLSQAGDRPVEGGFHHTRHDPETDLYMDWMIEANGAPFLRSEGRIVDSALIFTTAETGLRQSMTLPIGDAFEVLAELDGESHRSIFSRVPESP